MKKLSDTYNSVAPIKTGEIIEGRVIGQEGACLFVDLGPRGTGIIQGRELYQSREKTREIKKNDKIFAKVIDLETDKGYIELSLKDAQKEVVWGELAQRQEKREAVKVKVLGANKGGLLTKVEDIPAFLPVSQLSLQHYPKVEQGDPQKILKELQKFIGQELEVNIFTLDQKQNQIILSERLKETERKRELLQHYQRGDVVKGEITGVCNFGAFFKFPAKSAAKREARGKEEEKEEFIEGLIHISELDWQLVEDPSEIVKPGQKVKAKIVQIADEKVFLSLKQLKESPWEDIEQKIKKGEVIKGKVKKLNPFGAFVEIRPKIQGLCHISEFGSQKKMEEELKLGKSHEFKVLLIDPKGYKITLGLVRDDSPSKPPTNSEPAETS